MGGWIHRVLLVYQLSHWLRWSARRLKNLIGFSLDWWHEAELNNITDAHKDFMYDHCENIVIYRFNVKVHKQLLQITSITFQMIAPAANETTTFHFTRGGRILVPKLTCGSKGRRGRACAPWRFWPETSSLSHLQQLASSLWERTSQILHGSAHPAATKPESGFAF